MDDLIGADDYSITQLRKWLDVLGLPKNGSKATMASRLNAVSAELRGVAPPDEDPDDVQSDNQSDDHVNTKNFTIAEIERTKSTSENDTAGAKAVASLEEKATENDEKETDNNKKSTNEKATDENATIKNTEDKERTDNEKESSIEKLKLQLEMMKLENKLLINEKEKTKEVRNNGEAEKDSVMLLNMLREMLPTYHGKTADSNNDVTMWISQLRAVANVYNLNDNMLRMLIMAKLKDRALKWLHSERVHMIMPVDDLLEAFEETFRSKESKLALRRKFEARMWKYNEDFAVYFDEKLLLATHINIQNDELVDGIIEGIPDENLRRQAHMQCFAVPYHLLHAMGKVTLSKKFKKTDEEDKPVKTTTSRRCFNCNSLGHFAADCRKPKREWGACFACGSKEHRVADCSKKKANNEYNASSTLGAQ